MAFTGKIGNILKQAAKSNQSVHRAARLSEVIGQSTLYRGKIAEGKVITDRAAGMSKGFGFVTSVTNGEISAKLDRESSTSYISRMIKGKMKAEGTSSLCREHLGWYMAIGNPAKQLNNPNVKHWFTPYLARTSASYSTQASNGAEKEKMSKDISTTEDPFNAPTYNIPEKPVTFTEGASYTVVILAGLGVAIFAAYAVLKELIFEPKEYKIFGKALERVQKDSRVTVRIGSPVTGYGQESRNRAARQRISSRVWKDEEGVEHVQVNFFIRGPNGAGKVSSEMFKDQADKTWKFTYLIVEITSPSRVQLMLESYIPA